MQHDLSLHQRIARIDYLVDIPPGVTAPDLHRVQAEFAAGGPPTPNGIHVNLVVGEMPDLASWRVLVSSGPAWSIQQRGAARCLCLSDPSTSPRTGRVACWEGDVRDVTVYCGPEYWAVRPDGAEMRYAAGYPVDQILLMYYLARRQGLLVHAAGLVADERALIFPGVSGAGKSTLTHQFLARGASGLLSDDRMIVRWLDGDWQAFGTPWPGDAGVAVNAGAPLAAILFPVRGADTRIRKLSPQTALDRLLPATSVLWHEPELLTSQLETVERLLRTIPAFELAWSLSTGIVDDVHDFVRQL